MGKATYKGLVPPDDPMFLGGPQMFSRPAFKSPPTTSASTIFSDGPQSVQLLHMYGYGVGDDHWEWSAELERQEDGVVYLALIPTVDKGVEIDSPDAVAIVDGAALFEQLNSSWCDYADEYISEEAWQEVVNKVSRFDKTLGAGLADRIREENDPQPVPLTAADLWARRATWERTLFVGRRVGYAPQDDVRRALAVRNFVAEYQAQNGELPAGRHLIHADNAPSFWAEFSDDA